MLADQETESAVPRVAARWSALLARTIEHTSYDSLKQEILDGLSAESFDAVLLALHGAGVVGGIDDLEGDLCVAVRALVGVSVPVIATFDLHGNITQTMADALDGVFGVINTHTSIGIIEVAKRSSSPSRFSLVSSRQPCL